MKKQLENQPNENFGSVFRSIREKRAVTQTELAKYLGLGNSQFISNWERGRSRAPAYMIRKLAKKLEFSEQEKSALLAAIVVDEVNLAKKNWKPILGDLL